MAEGRTSKPPWPIEPATVAARIEELGLPHPGKEQFHLHALLHLYDDGLLVPVAANIGIDERRKIEAGLHTHDATGVIHLEADKPFRATLGDFFRLWGVRLSKTAIGGLEGDVHAYLTGPSSATRRPTCSARTPQHRARPGVILARSRVAADPRALLVANGEAKGKSSCRTKGGETQGDGCSIEQP